MAADIGWIDNEDPSSRERRLSRSNQWVVEEVAISDLKIGSALQRSHPEDQIARIRGSLAAFGQLPILVADDLTVIDGHAVVEASRRDGRNLVSVIRVSGLSPTKQRALMMALNQIGKRAKWNLDVLKADFEAILADPQIDFTVDVTGFDQVFIDNLLTPILEPEEDDLPDPPVNPVSRPGDLWRCGVHAILCGDSTKAETYGPLMGGLLARMVFGDVPYNVRIAGNVSGLGKRKHGEFAMASGEMSRAQFVAFQRQVFEHCAGVSLDGALHFYFIDWRHLTEQMEAGEAVFGPAKQMIVWVKGNGAMGAFYRSRHELITVWRAGDAPHVNNFGLGSTGRYRTNVWEYPGCSSLGKGREAALASHPTVKSLPMVIDGILDVTGRGEVVLDPFGGSGTTLIACERIGRAARLIEIDPKYVDVTLERFIAETGEQPILDATGETFEAVGTRRGADVSADAELDWDIL